MRFAGMKASLKRTAETGTDPVSVDDFKAHARIDYSEEDLLLAGYLKAARDMVERDSQRALFTQTWTLKLDAFPCDVIELRVCPVQSVTSIVYTDTAGASQTWSASNYVVDVQSEPATITLANGQTWPSTLDQANVVTVTFTAGYATASAVPPLACQLIRLLAAHWYRNRESVGPGNMGSIPQTYDDGIQRLCWAGYR